MSKQDDRLIYEAFRTVNEAEAQNFGQGKQFKNRADQRATYKAAGGKAQFDAATPRAQGAIAAAPQGYDEETGEALPTGQPNNAAEAAAPATPETSAPAGQAAAAAGKPAEGQPAEAEQPAEGQPAAAAPQSGATPQGGEAAATQNQANAGTAQTNQANPNAAAGQAAQPQDPQQLMSMAGQALDAMAKNPQHAVLLLQQVLQDEQAKQALLNDPEIQQWLVAWIGGGGKVETPETQAAAQQAAAQQKQATAAQSVGAAYGV